MSKAELSARLAAGEGRVATCWRLERRDGVVLGFTDHDRDLTFDGVVFRASSGLRPFALERSTGGSTDTSQAAGALSASAITEADILAGKYRGAEIVQWLVDWSDPAVRFIQMRAHVGEVRQGNGGFEAELLSLSDAFNTPVGRSYLKTCDVEFGSAKCSVDTDDPAWRTNGTVGGVEDRKSFLFDDAGGFAEGWFENGVLTWTSGANQGETMRIAGDTGAGQERRIELRLETPFPIGAGDGFELVAGCDKRFETCRDRFSNSANFRGFPHIPGPDWVMVYPRAGRVPAQKNDG